MCQHLITTLNGENEKYKPLTLRLASILCDCVASALKCIGLIAVVEVDHGGFGERRYDTRSMVSARHGVRGL